MSVRAAGSPRTELIADAALALLSERGMRGLTHRAVDETAGLPQGSTSNYARTRLALLEAAVRRLAEREASALLPAERGDGSDSGGSDSGGGREPLVASLAMALHRYLTGENRHLLVARYELALEATRRPELRAYYDAAGARFRATLAAMLRAAGSPDPERHTLSLVAWCDGLMFSCVAGSYHAVVPSEKDLRSSIGELLRGMLDGA
ncbi:TetR/AcrR family transcriptional regulator [Streptomyces sp. NPDC048436]|uniref:TetR/AcrR family transcriptional regulator n=1 Tax=Streptomyces sp. NPDC048436 TaxID=3365550 RepID=UPI003714D6A5